MSIFHQVAHILAVAEMSLEFEHRDLYLGNVPIKNTDKLISVKQPEASHEYFSPGGPSSSCCGDEPGV